MGPRRAAWLARTCSPAPRAQSVPTGGRCLSLSPAAPPAEFDDVTTWVDLRHNAGRRGRADRRWHTVRSSISAGGRKQQIPSIPRAEQSPRLDHLALGDWHRTRQARPGSLAWYAGTPEPDRAGAKDAAPLDQSEQCNRVPESQFRSRRSLPETYRWITHSNVPPDAAGPPDLDQRRAVRRPRRDQRPVLQLEGSLPLAAYAELQRRLVDIEAAVFHLEVDHGELAVRRIRADPDYRFRRRACTSSESVSEVFWTTLTKAPIRDDRAEEALVELDLRVAGRERQGGGVMLIKAPDCS